MKRAGRLPWHPLLLAAAIVLTAWIDAAVSPYAAFRPLFVALLIAAALTGIGALVTRSWQLGGIAATVVIALLWSKQLIDAAGGIIGRAGPIIGLVWILLIAAVVALVAYLAQAAPVDPRRRHVVPQPRRRAARRRRGRLRADQRAPARPRRRPPPGHPARCLVGASDDGAAADRPTCT